MCDVDAMTVYDFVIRETHLGVEVPVTVWLHEPLDVEPKPGAVLSPNDAGAVIEAMPADCDWDMQVTRAFVVIRDLLVQHMTEGAGAGDAAQAQQMNHLLRIVSCFDIGVQWLYHFWSKVFAVDSRPVTAAEVRQLFAEQAGKIELIHKELRPVGRNAIIERVRARGWANQKEAAIYLDRSDTFLRPYFYDPGDGPPDPNKLNARKGAKEWSVTVEEMDRFNRDVQRASAPTADLEGQEIRGPAT